jgi:hypothetical protein
MQRGCAAALLMLLALQNQHLKLASWMQLTQLKQQQPAAAAARQEQWAILVLSQQQLWQVWQQKRAACMLRCSKHGPHLLHVLGKAQLGLFLALAPISAANQQPAAADLMRPLMQYCCCCCCTASKATIVLLHATRYCAATDVLLPALAFYVTCPAGIVHHSKHCWHLLLNLQAALCCCRSCIHC